MITISFLHGKVFFSFGEYLELHASMDLPEGVVTSVTASFGDQQVDYADGRVVTFSFDENGQPAMSYEQ